MFRLMCIVLVSSVAGLGLASCGAEAQPTPCGDNNCTVIILHAVDAAFPDCVNDRPDRRVFRFEISDLLSVAGGRVFSGRLLRVFSTVFSARCHDTPILNVGVVDNWKPNRIRRRLASVSWTGWFRSGDGLRHIAGTRWGTRRYMDMDHLHEMKKEQAAQMKKVAV